jgi:cytidylate kinase
MGYLYLDTGVMYRAVTWAVLARHIDVINETAVSELAEKLSIEVTATGPQDGRLYTVLVDGEDVTWAIRGKNVEAQVSRVSGYARVRATLTNQQRLMAAKGSMIMVGRDIGTVVLPQAELKLFMEASPEERARRRYKELMEQGQIADYEAILAAIQARDKQDRENPVSPLMPAKDAIVIHTDGLSITEVVAKIHQLLGT